MTTLSPRLQFTFDLNGVGSKVLGYFWVGIRGHAVFYKLWGAYRFSHSFKDLYLMWGGVCSPLTKTVAHRALIKSTRGTKTVNQDEGQPKHQCVLRLHCSRRKLLGFRQWLFDYSLGCTRPVRLT